MTKDLLNVEQFLDITHWAFFLAGVVFTSIVKSVMDGFMIKKLKQNIPPIMITFAPTGEQKAEEKKS